ncbi:MAG: hypothetical protein IAF94_23810 [Pirellulaceae bacterium]|nr:hypothetical protein [Pirellulaceae bacterium]
MSDEVKPKKPRPTTPGTVEPETLYTLDEIKARLRWSLHSMRQARRRGLKVRYVGGRGFVHGQAVIDFILTEGSESI